MEKNSEKRKGFRRATAIILCMMMVAGSIVYAADTDEYAGTDMSSSPAVEESECENNDVNEIGEIDAAEDDESLLQIDDLVNEDSDDSNENYDEIDNKEISLNDDTLEWSEADIDKDDEAEKGLPEWYESGRTSGSFEISSLAELLEFAAIINDGTTTFSNSSVKLTADIDMSGLSNDTAWQPIGCGSSAFFAGTFDGDGHTISGINYTSTTDKYTGVFGYLQGCVKNLYISDCTFETAGMYAGVCTGYAGSGSSISDVRVAAAVLMSAGTYAGLAAGRAEGELRDVTAAGSVRCNAEVTDKDAAGVYAGGAVGYMAGGTLSHVVSSTNVSIACEESGIQAYAGGIAGETAGTVTIINCGNGGAITAQSAGGACAGGLAGKTDADNVTNCWNKGVVTAKSEGKYACAGGLFGESQAGKIYNSYSDTQNVTGGAEYTGYIVGNITGKNATAIDYVYWPGKGSYDSTLTYGNASTPLQAETTCRGIGKIASSSSLVNRLNTQVTGSADGKTDKTDLYMWKLVDESNPKSSPEFREEAPDPIFPNKPAINIEKTSVGLHLSENDPAHSAVIEASVSNQDADVKMTYQWQYSKDGESYKAAPAVTNEESSYDGKSLSYYVKGNDPGTVYYRLRVICSDEKADASRYSYSSVIAVTSGYRIKLQAGGLIDGSSDITNGGTADDIFPVVPDSGLAELPKTAASGMFFMGYANSHTTGQSYEMSDLLQSYDTTGMTGDISLWSIFRPAAKIQLKFNAGASTAAMKEGITEEQLSILLDEGSDYSVPDGNTIFENKGWRFMGWQVTEESNSGDNDDDTQDIDMTLLKPGDIYIPGTSDVSFTAVWHKMYSVSYEIGSKYAKGELPAGTEAVYIEGESFDLPSADALTYNGYAFDGWKDNISGKTYKEGETYTLPDDMTKLKDIVFTAQWRVIYVLTFHAAKDDSLVIQNPYSSVEYVKEYTSIKVPEAGDMKLDGYRFMGWQDGEGELYTPGEYYTARYNEDFYGIWKKIYYVSFTAGSINDDETAEISGSEPEKMEIVLDETIQLPENTFTVKTTKSDVKYYRFMGWKEKDEPDVVRSGGSDYKLIANGDKVFEAQWRAMTDGMSWDGSSSTKPVNGTGTADDPYRITTADELAWISVYMAENKDLNGVHFSLENDIDLYGFDWKPIGWNQAKDKEHTKNNEFNGIFSGNGHTIYGLASEYNESGKMKDTGLFGAIGKDGVVENLNLADADLCISDELDAINSYGTSTDNQDKLVGIIAGQCKGGTITGCTVQGSISYRISSESVSCAVHCMIGGIAGYAEDADITDCSSDVKIEGLAKNLKSSTYLAYSGGIAGIIHGTDIKRSASSGSIKWTHEGASILSCTGGIVGYADSKSSLSDCENTGDLSAEQVTNVIGGIAGYAGCNISACRNSGAVTVEAMASSTGSSVSVIIGGIAGRGGNISECINTGDIGTYLTNVSRIGVLRLGGISGRSHGDIENCLNEGNVAVEGDNADWYEPYLDNQYISVGGIAGVAGNSKIKNSFVNARKISIMTGGINPCADESIPSTRAGAGGIIGHAAEMGVTSPSNSYFNYQWNDTVYRESITYTSKFTDTGDSVGADSEMGGSSYSASGLTLENCYWLSNTGSVPEIADGSKLKSNVDNLKGLTAEQVTIGEAAYLLDGGSGKHRNEWTQSGGTPTLGSPSYYKAEATGNEIQLSDGTYAAAEVYAPEDKTINVVYDKAGKGIAVGDPYEHHRTKNGTVTTVYYYQKYYDNADIWAEYSDGEKIKIDNPKSFTMRACDVSVGAKFETDISKLDESKLRDEFHHAETVKSEEEQKPQPDENKGSGGGSGGGSGKSNNYNSGGVGDSDISSNGTPQGTDTDNEMSDGTANVPSLPVTSSDAASDTTLVIAAPSSTDAEPQVEQADAKLQQAEAAETGGNEEYEPEEQEPEPEQEKTPEVFEVVHDTVAENPILTVFLILLIMAIIIIAGYRRYRKYKGSK